MLMMLALFSGCSPTDSGNTVADQPIPNSAIVISGSAQVQSPAQSGKAVYGVTCVTQYTDQSKSNSDFNSAIVTVNGMTLKRYSDGFFVNTDTMRFSEGDSLEFIVKHPKIGTVRGSLQVPQSVSTYSIFPNLPTNNFANGNTTFSLSWNPVNADFYYILSTCYDSREFFVTQYGRSTSSDTVTIVLQDSTNHAYPFLDFRLMSFRFLSLPGFSSGSGFYVSSPYYKVYSNL